MSSEQAGVVAEVQFLDSQGTMHSLGPHRFVTVPRKGEEVVAEFDGQEATLRVRGVIHMGEPLEETRSVLKCLPIAALHIVCEKS